MLKLEIIASLAVIMCGQVLFWRRRDNIFGYFQAGLFFASVLIPVLGTAVIDAADPAIANRYAKILVVGAVGHLLGLCYGASIGLRSRQPPVTFDEPLEHVPRRLLVRSRAAALIGIVALLGAFSLLGYVPLLASDRLAAKYGIGPYRPGFERGAQLFHLALTLTSSIVAITLAMVVIRRRRIDVLLLGALVIGLASTLSRGDALAGPLAFLIAWGIEKRWRPRHLLAIVCVAFVAGALLNELTFVSTPAVSPSFSSRVAGKLPDIDDHIGFLEGYELTGNRRVGMKTIRAGLSLSPGKGVWDPSNYALRTRTGLSDVSELAAGGLRLPAAIWGYAAYGYLGALVWSFFSGVFLGWGTTLLRRMLTRVELGRTRHQALNLVLAWVFFNGTFNVLSLFYFPSRANIMAVLLAMALAVRLPLREPVPAQKPLAYD
jgi:hypothetical protein